jgi:hypothetical protein
VAGIRGLTRPARHLIDAPVYFPFAGPRTDAPGPYPH